MDARQLIGPGKGRGKGRGRSNSGQMGGYDGRHTSSSMSTNAKASAIFENTRILHAQASQQAMKNQDMYESSSEEDDLDEDQILSQLMKNYKGTLNGSDADDNNSISTRQYLYESCQSGAITCLVCISSVKRQEAIWNCYGCFATFHLSCIQRWIREGIARKSVLSDEHFPNKEHPWYCPKCRFEYKQHECPTRYICYCGKVEDPQFDPWLVPHSCGATCERLLRPTCGHKCLLLCHPGPCPPCPKMVKTSCYCGKKPQTVRRCGAASWSCGQQCTKLLSCGKHNCKDNCHEGICATCPHTSLQSCTCGKHKEERPCSDPRWKCSDECNKLLSCGIHKCDKVCHTGNCGNCPRSGWRTCPCGKSNTNDLPCSEDVPTCNDTCGKSRGCYGGHKCTRRCHYGSCGPCSVVIEKQCRCGKRKKEMPCHKEFTCDMKCQKMRDCGNHQCKRKCCEGDCPRCEQVCGRMLQCKRHKCQSNCHRGPCYPCILTSRVTCNCGSTGITVVCGKEKTTKPPRCKKPCKIPSSCHHPTRRPHNCHFGPCKRCTQVCSIVMKCGHSCPADCHDEVLVKNEQVKAAGPWELPYQSETTIKCIPCPPCKSPVPKVCLGDHERSNLPCFEARRYCCGRKCGRLLKCGNHTCSLLCHTVEGSLDQKMAGKNCAACEEPCTKPRPEGCIHSCSQPCHSNPCEPCKKRIRKRCHCGLVILHHLCSEWTAADDLTKLEIESCGNNCPKPLSCDHYCTKLCHPGPCPGPETCTKKMIIKCPCKRRKKDFVCPEVRNGAKVECDSVCEEIKAKSNAEKEEKLRQKKDEEARIRQIELEKFDRRMQKTSKSRRRRKLSDQVDDDSNSSIIRNKYFQIPMFLIVISVLVAFAYNLVLQSK
ncbi:NF-X1-type zinc finger protein NFXL1-like isoform X1 [Styela clava]